MDLTSIEISRSLLKLLRDLPEDEVERLVDSLRLEIAEAGDGNTTSFTSQDGIVGTLVLNREDGAPTMLTLKIDPD